MKPFGLVLGVALAAFTAEAEPITWTLNDVTAFGSSLTGSFVYDPDAQIYSLVNITANGPGTLSGIFTTPAESQSAFPDEFMLAVDSSSVDESGRSYWILNSP
jgi:hypothetical protein